MSDMIDEHDSEIVENDLQHENGEGDTAENDENANRDEDSSDDELETLFEFIQNESSDAKVDTKPNMFGILGKFSTICVQEVRNGRQTGKRAERKKSYQSQGIEPVPGTSTQCFAFMQMEARQAKLDAIRTKFRMLESDSSDEDEGSGSKYKSKRKDEIKPEFENKEDNKKEAEEDEKMKKEEKKEKKEAEIKKKREMERKKNEEKVRGKREEQNERFDFETVLKEIYNRPRFEIPEKDGSAISIIFLSIVMFIYALAFAILQITD